MLWTWPDICNKQARVASCMLLYDWRKSKRSDWSSVQALCYHLPSLIRMSNCGSLFMHMSLNVLHVKYVLGLCFGLKLINYRIEDFVHARAVLESQKLNVNCKSSWRSTVCMKCNESAFPYSDLFLKAGYRSLFVRMRILLSTPHSHSNSSAVSAMLPTTLDALRALPLFG